MGVLKRSSAAMIVLLLFFASLPGAKGMLHKFAYAFQKAKQGYRSPRPLTGCTGIPIVKEVTRLGRDSTFPAAAWFKDAAVTGSGIIKEMGKSSVDCTPKVIEEIASMGREKITSSSLEKAKQLKELFDKLMIEEALDYAPKDAMEREMYCKERYWFSDQNHDQSCKSIEGLSEWVKDLPICGQKKILFCLAFRTLLNLRPES